jgi:CoA:oxalate CoA-transferase
MREQTRPTGPLSHLTVLDFTQFLAGPHCTQVLGDLGADVLKIESLQGDMTRGVAPHFVGENSAYFWSLNRNKRSVAIDLKDRRGRDLALRLAERADVVVENFRPGVMDRLGLGWEAMRATNERLVYCAISGFGQTGPLRDYPAYDAIVQAMSGTMSITGEPDRPPVIIGPPVGDVTAAMYAAVGLLAVLSERDRTGAGQYVDVGMLDAQVALLSYHATYYMLSGVVPAAQGRRHVSLPTYRSFLCEDGVDVFVTANTERMWGALCHVVGLEELAADPRFAVNADRLAHKEELWTILEERFRTRPADEWVADLMEAGIPASRINTIDCALAEPQVVAREMVVDAVDVAGNTGAVVGNPIRLPQHTEPNPARVPLLGQDTRAVLTGVLGMQSDEVEALVDAGVVGTAGSPSKAPAA